MRRISELSDLTGRAALVTGGAGHVGRAAAETLIELGASVAIVDRDDRACAEAAAALNLARRDAAIPLTCDLLDEQATRDVVRRVVDRLDRLDILIHCAAFVATTPTAGWGVPFDRQTVAAWDDALRVNLTAGFILVQESRAILEQPGHGSVIFVSSIYGAVGPDLSLYEGTDMSNPVGYGASKGGLLQLTKYLSTMLAPRVRVNAISPGGIERGQPAAFVERYERRTPMKRMAREEDLKGAVAFLASDMSAYVTGHNLLVDGGWTAW